MATILGQASRVGAATDGLPADSLDYKFQGYYEDAGRITVLSHYLQGTKAIGDTGLLKAKYLYNAISGATPTGEVANGTIGEVPLAQLTDRREAVALGYDFLWGTQKLALEYSRGEERSPGSARFNYRSAGYAATWSGEFGQRQWTFSVGAAATLDEMLGGALFGPEGRDSYDFLLGVSRVLDPASVVTWNLTYGRQEGYLSDPYRSIRVDVELLPGLFLPFTVPENRPDAREKWISVVEYRRHFRAIGGSTAASWRAFRDSFGITSHTLDALWAQRLGDSPWVVQASVRAYDQTAADFYFVNLNRTGIEPLPFRADFVGQLSEAPYYSSDYRLSALRTYTWGLKLVCAPKGGAWSADLAYERYEMSGTDEVTPAGAYPSAHLVTVGGSYRF